MLDTNVFVWLFQGDTRLGRRSRSIIETERTSGDVAISAITPWEMSMLADKNRLDLGDDLLSWVTKALAAPGVTLVPISPEIAVAAGRLPGGIHGDPADRLIVATARATSSPLMTSDRRILDYADRGHLKTIHASR